MQHVVDMTMELGNRAKGMKKRQGWLRNEERMVGKKK